MPSATDTTKRSSISLHGDELDRLAKLDEGDLAEVSFAMLLYALSRARASATLQIARGPLRKEIYFEDGTPVDCRSNLVQETLSRFIVTRGRLDEATAEACYRESVTRSVRLGDILIEKQLVSAGELLKILQQNLAHKLLDGFSWRDGSFRVEGRPPRIDSPLKVNVPQLVFIGVNRFATQEQIDSSISPLIGRRLALNPEPPCSIDELKLAADHLPVAEQLRRGITRIDQLAAISGVSSEGLTRLLYALTLIEVVVPADNLSADPAAKPPPPASRRAAPAADEGAGDQASDALRDEIMELALNHRRKTAAQLLAVDADAEVEEIRRQYLAFARRYAPWQLDPSLEERACQLFLAGARAYAELCDRVSDTRTTNVRLTPATSGPGAPEPARPPIADDEGDGRDTFRIQSKLLDPEIQFQRGMELVASSDYGQALEQLEFAADLDPQNLQYAAERAHCRYACDPGKNTQKALEELRDVLRIEPQSGLALFYAGDILRRAGRFDEAESFLKRSLKPMAPDRRPVDALRELTRARKEADD